MHGRCRYCDIKMTWQYDAKIDLHHISTMRVIYNIIRIQYNIMHMYNTRNCIEHTAAEAYNILHLVKAICFGNHKVEALFNSKCPARCTETSYASV
jgi:hypothetical protein